MQMLNLKVIISRDGGIKMEGWFAPESDGLSSTTLTCYGQKAIHFSIDLTGGKTLADTLFSQAIKQNR